MDKLIPHSTASRRSRGRRKSVGLIAWLAWAALLTISQCAQPVYNPGDPASDERLRLAFIDCLLTRCWDPPWSILSSGAGDGNPPLGMVLLGETLYFSGKGGGSDIEWRLEKRSRTTGALAGGFGSNGVVTLNPTASADFGRGLAVYEDKIYWVGDDRSGTVGSLHIRRMDAATGSADASFGTGGAVVTNISGGNDHYRDVVLDGTDLYVLGNDGGGSGFRFRMEKWNAATGSVQTTSSFGAAGILSHDPSVTTDQISRGYVKAGALWVVGEQSTGGNIDWAVEKRLLSTGAYDTSFLGSGFYYPALSAAGESAQGLCFTDTHLFAVGGDGSSGVNRWRIEKRATADGALDSAFGSSGILLEDLSGDSQSDVPHACVVVGDLLVVVGQSVVSGQTQFHLEARNPTSGDVLWTVQGGSEWGTSIAQTLAADGVFLYVGIQTDQGWLLEKRFLATGKLR